MINRWVIKLSGVLRDRTREEEVVAGTVRSECRREITSTCSEKLTLTPRQFCHDKRRSGVLAHGPASLDSPFAIRQE
jgi:hypothetical protein